MIGSQNSLAGPLSRVRIAMKDELLSEISALNAILKKILEPKY